MKTHLQVLMKWSSGKMRGAHAFTRERPIFPPSGTSASPFGLAPYGSGSAPLRGTVGSTCFASQKTKASSLALLHTKACFKKGMLACARTKAYLQTTPYKGVAFGVVPSCPAPLRGQCHGANAGQGTQTTSALHKGVFYDRTCSLRSHKSVHSDACALALAQRRVL